MILRIFFRSKTSVISFFCFFILSFANSANKFNPENPLGDTKFKQLPIEFLENKGQLKDINNEPIPYVFFKIETSNINLYVTNKGLSYFFLKLEKEKSREVRNSEESEAESRPIKVEYEKVDLELKGANITLKNLTKEGESTAYFNYLMGDESYYHIRKYKKLTFRQIYPGIDWVLYNSSQGGFKYDFIVHPGADPAQIRLLYTSGNALVLDEFGNILLENRIGQLKEKAPVTYNLSNRGIISSAFKIQKSSFENNMHHSLISVEVARSETETLIIDPQLVWSTFYGGMSWEGTTSLDVDNQGNVYMTGYTESINFPLQSSGTYFQNAFASSFIVKFTNSGSLLWATYYGGTGTINATSIDCDVNDNVFVCGQVTSTVNFNLVNANSYFQNVAGGGEDCFIAKFDPTGNCLWSTYFGGDGNDRIPVCTTDLNGNLFVTGVTNSTLFPLQNAGTYFDNTTANTVSMAIQSFVTKFNNSGNLIWSTFVKGVTDFNSITTDVNGNVYLTGQGQTALPTLNPGSGAYFQPLPGSALDAFLMKFDNLCNQIWSTYYGGIGFDRGRSLACDKTGNLFVVGSTRSNNFPTQNAGTYYQAAHSSTVTEDLFLLKFNPSGVRLWATFFGGTRTEGLQNADHLAIDTCGNIYIGCSTLSRNIPVLMDCEGGFFDATLDTSSSPINYDIYLAKFTNNGAFSWGSYLGGAGHDFRANLGIDKSSNLFITGEWIPFSASLTASYPLVNGGINTYNATYYSSDDVYICKFAKGPPPQSFSYGTSCNNISGNISPTLAVGFINGGIFTSQAGLSLQNNTGQINAGASTPGTYTVNYNYTLCSCGNSGPTTLCSATVSILASPSLSVIGPATICVNENRNLTVSGANTYTWNNGAQSSTLSITSPANSTTLHYTVSGTYTNGCKSSTNFSVFVSPCVSTKEYIQNIPNIKIFPNPNSGEFVIESNQSGELELINQYGQLIANISLNKQNSNRIELNKLTPGLYFVVLKNFGSPTAWKIVVQN